MIRVMTRDEDIQQTFPVMQQLRPFLTEADYVERVRDLQEHYGWHLAALLVDGQVACVAGYKVSRSFHFDRYLYVDDLVTDDAFRSKGVGSQMLSWLEGECRRLGCTHLRLDSGVQRHGAHRFYLSHHMEITCHHFVKRMTNQHTPS